MKIRLFEGNLIKVMLHLVAWIILLGLPLYVIKRWQVGKDFIWLYYINTLISGIIFYVNYSFLAPKFFFSDKKYRYYFSVLILIGCFYFVSDISNKLVFRYASGRSEQEQIERRQAGRSRTLPPGGAAIIRRPGPPPFRGMHLYNYSFTSIFLIFFSLGLRSLERHSHIENLQKETEKAKLNSELAFLKSQISPHFFFNTLNNIYSLISINTEDSQKAVLKLSKLMRYLLYDSEKGKTMLSNEIEFMTNYIDLMKLRMSDKVKLEISFPENYTDRNIPPLLFVPFIENAFKHGISYRGPSYININMEIDERSIKFRCVNSMHAAKKEPSKEHKGIGLENVSKRLQLLFPGTHDLRIKQSELEFEIYLILKFTS
jgi:two-component system LytT family sensor kinase